MPIQYKKQYLCDLDREAFLDFFKDHGVGRGKSKEIFKTLYQGSLIELKAIFQKHKKLDECQLQIHLFNHHTAVSKDHSTKFLMALDEKNSIEAVRMPIENRHRKRITLCVSSQVGCALDCSFCVTGTLGLSRNLKTWEIVEQVILANHIHSNEPVSNVVFMGMGEPFYNYEAVKKATQILSDDCGLRIARKHITVSTAGVVPRILDWAEEGQTHLAVSLIAAQDKKRSQLMSINDRYGLDQLLHSIAVYCEKTRKKVFCEYILIKDVTDTSEDIAYLSKKLATMNVKLNLIPYNENKTLPYQRPNQETIFNFQAELKKKGVVTTIRWSHGEDVDAACGQLKENYKIY